ncbi:hypothetical protein OAQ99_03020 [Candidatus Kapabacteria bacterium]|nr:hypothetical protein [Candidatus Kapabacteria bacterium]
MTTPNNLKVIFYNHHDDWDSDDFTGSTRIYELNQKKTWFYITLVITSIILFSFIALVVGMILKILAYFNLPEWLTVISMLFIVLYGTKYWGIMVDKLSPYLQQKMLGNGKYYFEKDGYYHNGFLREWTKIKFDKSFELIHINNIKDNFSYSVNEIGVKVNAKNIPIKFKYDNQEVKIEDLTDKDYHLFMRGLLYFYFDKHLDKKFK